VSRLRLLTVTAAVVLHGCLPIPHRETETVEVVGSLARAGVPLVGQLVSVEQPAYVGPGQLAPCSGVAPVITDAQGVFRAPRRTRWRAWVALLGESAEWRIPTRLCLRDGGAWRSLHHTRVNGWDAPLRLRCDLATPVRRDDATGEEGRCARELVTPRPRA
jgi:hypothetical protein